MDIQTISVLLGIGIGLIMSLTGAGGTVLAVPLLVFALHLPVVKAAPVGLLSAMLASCAGALLGLRAGIVRYKAAGLMAACGLICAPAGLWLAQRLSNIILTLTFALVLGVIAVRILREESKSGHDSDAKAKKPYASCKTDPLNGRFLWTAPCARRLIFSGASAGLLSGLLGVGGGFVIVPALRAASDLDIQSSVATALATTALVTAGGAAIVLYKGTVDWHIALPFAAGAVIGMLAGRLVAHRISATHIHRLFAVLALAVAAGLLLRLAA